ncbi:MAG: rhomboid family intramembrane serine protease [Flavobacteriales bacterium]|nr:rhomboid family intramembrane serine protease [Flavobacteriales bacterium]
MNQQIRPGGYSLLPPVVKNLIIINGLFYLGAITLTRNGFPIEDYLALHMPQSVYFRPHQFFTHMFMHDLRDLRHILTNMFALWMFGSAIENVWGGKRFLSYYLITGLGAAALHLGVSEIEFFNVIKYLSSNQIAVLYSTTRDQLISQNGFANELMNKGWGLLNQQMVGASGAIFGILMAFGMMFPNNRIFFIFFPIPIKAKYLVAGFGIWELYRGLSNNPDGIAHFAHLGGMLFGYILIRYWQRNRTRF